MNYLSITLLLLISVGVAGAVTSSLSVPRADLGLDNEIISAFGGRAGNNNSFLGRNAGRESPGDRNVGLGTRAGSRTTGNDIKIIGYMKIRDHAGSVTQKIPQGGDTIYLSITLLLLITQVASLRRSREEENNE